MKNVRVVFIFLCIATTSVTGMELKQRFHSTDNPSDVCVQIEESPIKDYENFMLYEKQRNCCDICLSNCKIYCYYYCGLREADCYYYCSPGCNDLCKITCVNLIDKFINAFSCASK